MHTVQQMPLPLTVSCSSKSRLVYPSWFYLSGTCSPGWSRTNSRRAVKRLCVCMLKVMMGLILGSARMLSYLQRNLGRVENLLTQITNGSGVPVADMKGKHGNCPNRISSEDIDHVKEHICSFPTYKSHYSRMDNMNRVYLGEELSISKMHRLYLMPAEDKGWSKVTETCHRRVFTEN